MRVIKFRAKGIGDKKWHYGSYVYTNDNVNNPFNSHITDKHHIIEYHQGDFNMGGWEQIEIDPLTIGQFTGLKDKNDNDIYEGDVLAFNNSYVDFNDVLEVRYVRGVFAFLWNGNLDDECPVNAPTNEWANVIGNIYDNPELLNTNNK
jgi:uncharacterized phage protein (TIGR01671 family)